jgi:hypothetical protein
MKKAHVVITVVAAVVIAGAGGAFAASKLDSPTTLSQAIIADAAGQLNIDPARLTSALEKAIDNQIDAAVKAGRLTPDQGAALKKRVDSGQMPLVGGLGLFGFGHGFGHGHGGFGAPGFGASAFGAASAALASYLGITPAQLRTELLSGKTLAQIAVAHNKTADGVVATLVGEAKKKLDAAVAAGKLPAAKEQTFLDHLKTLLTAVVNGKMPSPSAFGFRGSHLAPHAFARPGGFGGFRFGPRRANAPTAFAERS